MARHAYWVILVGATPTAFRSSTRDVLVPTWRQLQRTQSDVTLRWFERGRLWESPEAARFGMRAKPEAEKRRPDWRPGGDHRDPRARFELTRDQKRARFKDRARRTREEPPAGGSGSPPSSPDAPQPPDRSRKPWSKPWSSDRPPRRPWQRPKSDRPKNGRGPGGRFPGPRGDRPQDPRGPRPAPHGPVTPHAPGHKPQDRAPKPQGPFTPSAPSQKPYRPFPPDRGRPKGRGPGGRPRDRRGPGRPPGGRGGPSRGGGGNRHR
jgi:hypothetical protein